MLESVTFLIQELGLTWLILWREWYCSLISVKDWAR